MSDLLCGHEGLGVRVGGVRLRLCQSCHAKRMEEAREYNRTQQRLRDELEREKAKRRHPSRQKTYRWFVGRDGDRGIR